MVVSGSWERIRITGAGVQQEIAGIEMEKLLSEEARKLLEEEKYGALVTLLTPILFKAGPTPSQNAAVPRHLMEGLGILATASGQVSPPDWILGLKCRVEITGHLIRTCGWGEVPVTGSGEVEGAERQVLEEVGHLAELVAGMAKQVGSASCHPTVPFLTPLPHVL